MAVLFAASSVAQIATGAAPIHLQVGSSLTPYTKSSIRQDDEAWATTTSISVNNPSTVFWISYHLSMNDVTWGGSGVNLSLRNSSGLEMFRINGGGDEILDFHGRNSSGTLTQRVAIAGLDDAFSFRLDIGIDFSATGGYRVYLNGNPKYTVEEDLSSFIDPITLAIFGANSAVNVGYIGAIIMADEDTRGMLLQETRPTAEGLVFDDFVGDYSMLTANGVNVGGTVQGLVDGASQSYITEDLNANFASGYEILAVVVNSRSSATADSPLNILSHIITDGINTLEGGDIVLDNVPQPRVSVFSTAPDGTPWDATKFNAAEFGLRSKLNV